MIFCQQMGKLTIATAPYILWCMAKPKKNPSSSTNSAKYFLIGLCDGFASPFTLFFPPYSNLDIELDDFEEQVWQDVGDSLRYAMDCCDHKLAEQEKLANA